jgi:hypothetical protein
VEAVSHERFQGRERVGARFVDPSDEVRRALLGRLCEAREDACAHEFAAASIAAAFLVGVVGYSARCDPRAANTRAE